MDAAAVGVLSAAGVVVAGIAFLVWWKRRHRSSINDVLAAVAFARMRDIVVPDGMGGEIHVEHLLLTARGVLVVDVKRYEGVVFASNLMDTWTSIGAEGRTTFPNPLGSLYDRVAAVRQLIREIDVAGFIVFPAKADFSKGRPEHVLLPDDLLEAYPRPEADQVKQLLEAFAPHWERLQNAAQPASA
jgi:hypothetical protein